MKKILLAVVILFAITTPRTASAQVNVNVNIGSQPQWGPAGYDYAEYYYMPDIETYYYVPKRQFIYFSNGNWVFAYGLPPAHRGYNLYTGYKVVINQHDAYRYYNTHRVKYVGYKNNRSQVIIKNKPVKVKFKANNGNGNGNGGGNGKGKGHGNGHH